MLCRKIMSASSWVAWSRAQDTSSAAVSTPPILLDRFAGADSQWAVRAHTAFDENTHSMETGARELSDVLRAWADQVEAGIVPIRQVDAHGARAVASSDLMEQVQRLTEDRDVHPAASIVLAGAALEVALRSAIEELSLTLPAGQRPSSGTFACAP